MEVYVGIRKYIYDGHNLVTILFDTPSLNLYPYTAKQRGKMTIKCTKCHTDNREDSKFCKECATPLPRIQDAIQT